MTATHAVENTVQVPGLGRYEVDPRNSTVEFKGRHLFGLLPVRGTFTIADGVIDVAEPIAESSVRVAIDATSFQTGNSHRDDDVRSARFLNTGRYPSMMFMSTRLERSDGGSTLAGTLTVRDVARPLSLMIQQCTVQAASPESLIVLASTRIDRNDFGLTAAPGLAGRHLDVSLRVLGVRR
jgi:polyisoprenoid-binding protein YceI